MTTTKFSKGDRVQTEEGYVGIVTNIYITNETNYVIEFIDENRGDFEESEIKSTKLEPTTSRGVSKENYEKHKEEERIKQEKKDKASKIIDEIRAIKNRYAGKCKDGKIFWELYNEDVANLISMEITGKKYEKTTYFNPFGGYPFVNTGWIVDTIK